MVKVTCAVFTVSLQAVLEDSDIFQDTAKYRSIVMVSSTLSNELKLRQLVKEYHYHRVSC